MRRVAFIHPLLGVFEQRADATGCFRHAIGFRQEKCRHLGGTAVAISRGEDHIDARVMVGSPESKTEPIHGAGAFDARQGFVFRSSNATGRVKANLSLCEPQ